MLASLQVSKLASLWIQHRAEVYASDLSAYITLKVWRKQDYILRPWALTGGLSYITEINKY